MAVRYPQPIHAHELIVFLAPLSVYEVALDLIQAGFTPSKSHYLREKMRYVIDQSIKSAIEGFHVSLPEGKSAEAYVIPGPYIFLVSLLS